MAAAGGEEVKTDVVEGVDHPLRLRTYVNAENDCAANEKVVTGTISGELAVAHLNAHSIDALKNKKVANLGRVIQIDGHLSYDDLVAEIKVLFEKAFVKSMTK
jgi:hypothetical protein